MRSVRESWSVIDGWCARHRPRHTERLGPPIHQDRPLRRPTDLVGHPLAPAPTGQP